MSSNPPHRAGPTAPVGRRRWAALALAATLVLVQTLLALHQLEHLAADADDDGPAFCELCAAAGHLATPLPAVPPIPVPAELIAIAAAAPQKPAPLLRCVRLQGARGPPSPLRSAA
jgi:hypothetical protein